MDGACFEGLSCELEVRECFFQRDQFVAFGEGFQAGVNADRDLAEHLLGFLPGLFDGKIGVTAECEAPISAADASLKHKGFGAGCSNSYRKTS